MAVLEFPKHRIVREATNEELAKAKQKQRLKEVDAIIEEFLGGLGDAMDDLVQPESDQAAYVRDMLYLGEVVKSAIYRVYGVEFYLQKIVDETIQASVTIDDEDESPIKPEEEVKTNES